MTETELDALARVFVRGFPRMDDDEQRFARGVYRALCRGAPVAPGEIAKALGLSSQRLTSTLRTWSDVGWDDQGRVVALLGLTIQPTVHRFGVDGGVAYTWCAWDSLFIPPLLGAQASVHSICPATGEDIRLEIGPAGVAWVDPPDTGISFLVPDEERLGAAVTTSFCQFVHFLRPAPRTTSWLAARPELFLLSLDEGFGLGQRVNSARFGLQRSIRYDM